MSARPSLVLAASLLLAAPALAADEWPAGIPATGPDGKELNLDFEAGDLSDWVATGNAFEKQPVKGDTVGARRNDMRSGHRGDYWVGGYEFAQDPPQGTLTSATVRVGHPWASFLVGGGHWDVTRVEELRKDTGKAIVAASGEDNEEMKPVVVDLREHQGREIFVRLVDEHSGHWGHVNFDEFRFHDEKPTFPTEPRQLVNRGLDPEAAARAMTVPEGFRVTLAAGEPDVQQPIAMTIDDRGRVWVAEAHSYPIKRPQDQAKDRILIFEDADGDGRFDSRKVFIEGLNLVSGLEVGFGGVWVGQAPYLLFIPDKDGDDTPDGEPQVLLDGWHYEDTHETLNAFIWGPDGWLYGCHGVFTHSRVGKPGTPDEERQPINAGIWRYHPTKHVFEVFAHGTSNPWGVDFNDRGQCFLTCCVIPHLFHVIQGARYERQAGQHFNPHTYEDIKTIAKHRHWVGNQWNQADRNRSDDVGGGHAHAGAMIYLGGAWPVKYRDQIFMNNIHGARLNQDVLAPHGSGYVGDRAPDFLLANDVASQILYMRSGPDGQVYMIDWYDMNQCHHGNVEGHDRTNGRIFKISYEAGKAAHSTTPPLSKGGSKAKTPARTGGRKTLDLKALPSAELVKLQLEENDWYVRQSRRILQERGPDAKTHELLAEIAFNHDDETRRLRALWALHVTQGLTPERLNKALRGASPCVRGWAVQLALEDKRPSDDLLKTFSEMARDDDSPVVRLYLAAALQRLPLEHRWEILGGLLSHAEDAEDHNLPLMSWYAAEPLAEADMRRALELVAGSKVPLVKAFMLRRIAAIGSEEAVAFLIEALGRAASADEQLTFLRSIGQALQGRRSFPMPEPWAGVYGALAKSENAAVREQGRMLAVTFGDPKALAELRDVLKNAAAGAASRRAALAALLAARDANLAEILQGLVTDKAVGREAIRGLAAYADAKTPQALLLAYPSLTAEGKRDALNTLAARAEYAHALLDAVETETIARTDLSADVVRQLGNLDDESLRAKLNDVWGVVRETAADKQRQIEEYRKLIEGQGAKPDLSLGRAVFAKTCAQCHKLFGVGGTVGPELTGSNRANLDYLLSNVIDPSAVMAKDYQPSLIVTTEGRTITGIVKQRTDAALTVVTANETVVVPRDEVDILKPGEKSMMPDDLWRPLAPHEVRSLVAYLAGPRQVPMTATADNVKSFFNGEDLTGWAGNPDLWKVEDGEIVGTSPGIKHNEFLTSDLLLGDFELNLEVKLTPNTENSGIQFRSERLEGTEMRGYQADVGAGWWGKLYEESGRGLLWDKSGEKHVKPGEWNAYRIVAVGDHVRTWINGEPCVDLKDPQGAKRGIIGLQIHSGGPMEVRFRKLELSLEPGE